MERSTITRVFRSGNSQAIRIPKDFQLDCQYVEISSDGEVITLKPFNSSWVEFFLSEDAAPDEFMDFNRDDLPQSRDMF